jgi:hypothetical protein
MLHVSLDRDALAREFQEDINWMNDSFDMALSNHKNSGLSSSCVLCSMLPVSLDCPFLIAITVFFNVYLTYKNYFLLSWTIIPIAIVLGLFCQKIVSFAASLGVNLHFMKVSTENDNNFGYEKITILSLDCLHPVSCAQCCLCLWIVFILCLVLYVACVSGLSILDCPYCFF